MTVLCAWAEETPPRVLEASRWLGRELAAPVVIAHGFDAMAIQVPPSRELAYAGFSSDELSRIERGRIEALLEHAAGGLGDVPHTTALRDGLPVPVLLALAAEHQARLLISGTATRGAVDRILVGSVSSELANRAACPVVVVPEDATVAGSGPVIAGYDESQDSMRAVRQAAGLAAKLDRELVEMHVTDADPAERLTQAAHDREAALLVVGTRGRGAVTSALLGSVSAGVVRRAERPIVLVGPAAESILPC